MSIMQMLLSTGSAAVYTFEMWGAGGGGGGPENNSALDTEHSGPGGGGAYVGGTLTGLTSGTVLELLSGAIGKVGTQGITSETNSGGGGGASAIRIQNGAVVAAAGGGGGGGAAGGGADGDATGGRGGNSVDGSGGYATDVNDTTAGIGGQSGTSTTAGTHTTTSAANPQVKNAYGQGGPVIDSADDDATILATGTSLFTINDDFTLEAWINVDAEVTNNTLFRIGDNTQASLIGHNASGSASGTWSLYLPNATNDGWTTSNATLFTGLTPGSGWHHVAVTKSGTTYRGFVDGVKTSADITDANTHAEGNGRLQVGVGDGNSGNTYGIDCQWQDVRYTKGVARYTSNFTPPSEPLPTSSAGDSNWANVNLLLDGSSTTSDIVGSATLTPLGNISVTTLDDLQDGGQGVNRAGNTGGRANNNNPAGWGGSGGDGTTNAGNEGSGGGGGGGYFGGSGGSAATTGNNSGAGGGGGGSYTNATYVSSYSSAEGSFESGTAHSGSAPNQTAGSSATAYTTSKGKGGDGALAGGSFTDGQPGGVYIYKDGVLVASVATSAGTTTYTIP